MTVPIRKRPGALRAIAAIAAVALAAATACSSDGEPEVSATLEPLQPEQVIERASDALSGVETFRFSLSHASGYTVLTNGIEVRKASGTAAAPDRYTLDADTLVGGFFVNTEVVVIGANAYMTHPVSRRWQLLEPDANPFGTFNPVRLVASILEQVRDASLLPGASGGDAYVVGGSLPASALSSLTGGVDETAPGLAVQITVDGTSFLPVEARVDGRATAAEPQSLVRTVRLFGFNSDIAVEPPI